MAEKLLPPSINGTRYRRTWKPGPKPMNLVSIHAELRADQVEKLRAQAHLVSVNEQIRRAVDLYLSGVHQTV